MKATAVYPFQLISCIILLLAFLWLSVGTSFMQVNQQQKADSGKVTAKSGENQDESGTPFDKTSEENTENSSSVFSEEFLGEHPDHSIHATLPLKHEKTYVADAFIDFYGESVSPPPKSLAC